MNPYQEIMGRIAEIRRKLEADDPEHLYPYTEPQPPATPSDLSELAANLGRDVPEELRSVLTVHNGWPGFFQSTDLLSTQQMVSGRHHDDAVETLEITMETTGPVWEGVDLKNAIVFGVCRGEDIYLLNPAKLSLTGRMEVVWWRNGVISRHDSMLVFLERQYELLVGLWRQLSGM